MENLKYFWTILINDNCIHEEIKSRLISGNVRYLSLLLFVAENRDLYELSSEIHNINTRFSSDLHTPTANLTTFQKGPFYFGIKVFIIFLLASKRHLMT
jgi:hypothetical protein